MLQIMHNSSPKKKERRLIGARGGKESEYMLQRSGKGYMMRRRGEKNSGWYKWNGQGPDFDCPFGKNPFAGVDGRPLGDSPLDRPSRASVAFRSASNSGQNNHRTIYSCDENMGTWLIRRDGRVDLGRFQESAEGKDRYLLRPQREREIGKQSSRSENGIPRANDNNGPKQRRR
jgi:hypothetical protein